MISTAASNARPVEPVLLDRPEREFIAIESRLLMGSGATLEETRALGVVHKRVLVQEAIPHRGIRSSFVGEANPVVEIDDPRTRGAAHADRHGAADIDRAAKELQTERESQAMVDSRPLAVMCPCPALGVRPLFANLLFEHLSPRTKDEQEDERSLLLIFDGAHREVARTTRQATEFL